MKKMSKKMMAVLLALAGIESHAQHDNNWHFGQRAALEFSTGAPLAHTSSTMISVEGSASFSDASGNLQFYTNGEYVWNKNNQIMPNGQGLWGHASSSQGTIIVPKPGSQGIYYIFTADKETGVRGLRYTEVDMALDGGLGDVTLANTSLATPICEKISATMHANGTDIWVITHLWNSNAFYSYMVTANGVDPMPVISNTGVDIIPVGLNTMGRYLGGMAVSPDGTKLAIANNNTETQLLDFDNATGQLNNPISIFTGTSYGVAFSPKGSRLYITGEASVFQFDTAAQDVGASRLTIASAESPYALRLAPDGKIYAVSRFMFGAISVITDPEMPGAACNFMREELPLAGHLSLMGLPAFLTSPLYVNDITYAVQDCTGMSVTFSAMTTIEPQTVFWDFGDGTTSTAINPSHTYAAPGTYTVKIKVGHGLFGAYFTKQVTVIENVPLPIIQPSDMLVCDAENDGTEVFILSSQQAEILGNIDPSTVTVSYHDSLSDAQAGTSALTAAFSNIANPQAIYVRVGANGTGCYAITSFSVYAVAAPEIIMEDNYDICPDTSLTLTAPEGYDGYLWSSGQQTQSITVSAPGSYNLTVFKSTGALSCQGTKDITVTSLPEPEFDIEPLYTTCSTVPLIITIKEGFDSYLWSNGTTANAITLSQGGDYTITVTEGACQQTRSFKVVEESCDLSIPKGISPNGDAKNDSLDLSQHQVRDLSIFNRYGKLVYQRTSYKNEWHGQDENGRDLPAGTYYYRVEMSGNQMQTGWIYLSKEL